MFEELYEPLPDPARYWSKLGIEAPQTCSRKELDRIVFAHQRAIPFENLDACDFHVPVSLGVRDMFEKIVVGMRGGYCFELNALFAALLADAGFEVVSCFARSLKDRGFIQPVAHRGTIVTIDGQKLFCDVGYGGPMPPCALPLEDGVEAAACGQVFCIERVDELWWRMLYCGREQARRDEPEPVLAFMDAAQHEVDFVALSHYCATHPTSIFTRQRMINRRTLDGSVSITADRFTKTTKDGKEQRTIASDEEFCALLEKHFGIELPEGAFAGQ